MPPCGKRVCATTAPVRLPAMSSGRRSHPRLAFATDGGRPGPLHLPEPPPMLLNDHDAIHDDPDNLQMLAPPEAVARPWKEKRT